MFRLNLTYRQDFPGLAAGKMGRPRPKFTSMRRYLALDFGLESPNVIVIDHLRKIHPVRAIQNFGIKMEKRRYSNSSQNVLC
jgi:hypothetical protein